MGPNVKRLIATKMAQLAVPPGGGLAAAIDSIVTPGKLSKIAKEATQWVEEAIAAVKAAPDAAGKWTEDEAIAGEILNGIERRQRLLAQSRRQIKQ
jgi:aspartate oxidase